MAGYIDLHCHWIPAIDDGAPDPEASREMLRGLARLGFTRVIATPHMRPGLFDNTCDTIRDGFARTVPELIRHGETLPELEVSSEHYFDDVVFERLLEGRGVPYPGNRAVLLEFYDMDFPTQLDQLLGTLKTRGLTPVIAHPERYRPLWKKPEILERLLDAGAVALLDTCALVGKYGRHPERCARELLDRGMYHAACSDAHRPDDIEALERAIAELVRTQGAEEADYLLREGPLEILTGQVQW